MSSRIASNIQIIIWEHINYQSEHKSEATCRTNFLSWIQFGCNLSAARKTDTAHLNTPWKNLTRLQQTEFTRRRFFIMVLLSLTFGSQTTYCIVDFRLFQCLFLPMRKLSEGCRMPRAICVIGLSFTLFYLLPCILYLEYFVKMYFNVHFQTQIFDVTELYQELLSHVPSLS